MREHFNNLDITLVLNSNFDQVLKHDPNFKTINIVKGRKFSEYIMANSLESPGFCTILSHIITMKRKILPNIVDKDSLMAIYVEEMVHNIFLFILT